jgi:hypothetical protein
MSTVVRRVIRSSPHRDTVATWEKIVDLLTRGSTGPNRDELLKVRSVASAMIAERAPDTAPIVVVCDGPRTRIYCRYDDKAIEGTDAEEEAFGFDPLNGNWTISLPAPADDLSWVQTELKTRSSRVTARDMSEKAVADPSEAASATANNNFTVDEEAFLKL